MKLSDLLCDLFPDKALPNFDITTLTESSAQADAQSLFVCICGSRADGHGYAPDAYRHGCRHFLAQKPLSLPADAQIFYCEDARKALAHLAARLHGHPSHRMRLIGITGTKGKTTTALLIAHILNCAGIACGYIGTNGVIYGNVSERTANTTPAPLTLQRHLADMLASGVQTAVIEVSSQALLQYRADGTRFETAVFTNLFSDHIGVNEHPDFESYRACKRRLFHEFEAKNIIFNADDPAAPMMVGESTAEQKISCSLLDPSADLFAEALRPVRLPNALGVEFQMQDQNGSHFCRLPMMGNFNALNALIAAAVTNRTFGIPFAQITAALADVSVEGRSEVISLPNGACAVIDYAHNGESLSRLLCSLRAYTDARLVVVFGSVGERSQIRRTELGDAAVKHADLAILTSDNPGKESPDDIIKDIATAFEGSSTPYLAIPDRADAIRAAVNQTSSGDILVLAGKGHESYQLVGSQKLPFCEKEILLEEVKNMTAASR